MSRDWKKSGKDGLSQLNEAQEKARAKIRERLEKRKKVKKNKKKKVVRKNKQEAVHSERKAEFVCTAKFADERDLSLIHI